MEKTIRDSTRPVSEFEIMRKEKFLIHAPGTAHVSVWALESGNTQAGTGLKRHH